MAAAAGGAFAEASDRFGGHFVDVGADEADVGLVGDFSGGDLEKGAVVTVGVQGHNPTKTGASEGETDMFDGSDEELGRHGKDAGPLKEVLTRVAAPEGGKDENRDLGADGFRDGPGGFRGDSHITIHGEVGAMFFDLADGQEDNGIAGGPLFQFRPTLFAVPDACFHNEAPAAGVDWERQGVLSFGFERWRAHRESNPAYQDENLVS